MRWINRAYKNSLSLGPIFLSWHWGNGRWELSVYVSLPLLWGVSFGVGCSRKPKWFVEPCGQSEVIR